MNNKNIISFSLWGDDPKYWVGAKKNIELAKQLLPNFICRFYIDSKSDENLINTIIGDNTEIVLVESKGIFHGAFWRFWAAEDNNVNIFLSRDCDSRISFREVNAINEWLATDKDFHIMRDHPYHTVRILAGMWGCRNNIMKKIGLSKLINNWNMFDKHGTDQDFLGDMVYPLIVNQALEHSEFGLNYGGQIKPFPTTRIDCEYVGDIFDENNCRHPDYWKLILK